MSFEADYIRIDEYTKRTSIHLRAAYRMFRRRPKYKLKEVGIMM